MNLAHLYYFRKLVEVKNYSRAAEELFIAQPTLSLAVSSLERELGCILVKKRRNALELTEEGEEFYDAVVTATNALDDVTRAIKEQAAEEYGSIRVGRCIRSKIRRGQRLYVNTTIQLAAGCRLVGSKAQPKAL